MLWQKVICNCIIKLSPCYYRFCRILLWPNTNFNQFKKYTLTSHCHLVVTYSCLWWISNVNERRLVVSFKCDYLLPKCQPLNTYHVGKIATYLISVFRVWFIKYSPNMDRCFGSSRNVLSQRRRSSIFKHAGQVKYDMKSSSFELAGRGIKPWTR